MRLRTKYILFVVILHGLALVLSYYIFREDKLFFILTEAVIIVSAFLSWQLFRQLIQPLKLLTQGAEAIQDRDFTVKFRPTGTYEMDQLITVYNQMMDELRTERTKQEQQHLFLEKLIYTSPTGILILDYDDHIQQANPKTLQLLGSTENDILGKSIHQLSHPVFEQVKQLKSGQSATFTFNSIDTYKLQKSHFIDRGFPRHFVMIEELTAEILAAEKKAYGKVIRMMAHEVNNSIGPVNSILQSALSARNLWSATQHAPLQNALQVAIERNQNLNIFMRNFADLVRLPTPNKTSTDLQCLLGNVVHLMEMKAVEKHIQFQYIPSTDGFFIIADTQQLEQVLINIVKNAIEACDTDGQISLHLNHKTRILNISDNGKGISPLESEQLFTPFFSTKRDGQGIGLTLVKEILLNHGFEFSLKTLRVKETTFTIKF